MFKLMFISLLRILVRILIYEQELSRNVYIKRPTLPVPLRN